MRRWLFLVLPVCLAACDAAQIDACKAADDVICGIARPEDIELMSDTAAFLVSELGAGERPGRILLVDPETKERRVLAEGAPTVLADTDFPKCGAPPVALRPRGFHLSQQSTGSRHLLVVAGTRIERYRLDGGGANVSLAWEGCVDIPKDITANDVAGFPDGNFVVSHMYTPPRNFWLNLKFVLGLNTGYVAKWSRDGGWTKVPNTDVSFANGIQVDPMTSRIFVSSMFTQRIIAVEADGSNPRESARLPIQNDNLSWSDDGRLIGAGHTGFPIYGISKCREIGDAPCSFPFAIVSLDAATLAPTTLFETKTGNIPGASVAAVRGDVLYLGTAFGDRITRVAIKPFNR